MLVSIVRRGAVFEPAGVFRSSAVWITIRPDIPKCARSTVSSSKVPTRYLARRDSDEAPAAQPIRKVCWYREAQIAPPDFDFLDTAAFHRVGQASTHGFNFRKLGHTEKVAVGAPAR